MHHGGKLGMLDAGRMWLADEGQCSLSAHGQYHELLVEIWSLPGGYHEG